MLAPNYYASTDWSLGLSSRATSIDADFAPGVHLFSTAIPNSIGGNADERITLSPTTAGQESLTVQVRPTGMTKVSAVTTVNTVNPASTPAFKALLVGDSLTAAQTYPTQVQTRIAPAGTLVGTQGDPGAPHEGRGGWAWNTYASNGSPFVTGGVIDIDAYLATLGDTPDVVVWLLFTNRIFTATEEEYAAVLADELADMSALISAWTESDHAIVLPLPGNTNDAAFSDRRQWRERNQDIKQQLLSTYASTLGVYIIPGETSVDASTAYNDALHPANDYASLGDSVAAFLHWHAQQ